MWKSQPKASSTEPAGESRETAAKLQHLAAENDRFLSELAAMQDRSRVLARSVWRVQEDERRMLARELHDGVGQSLTALRHQMEQLPAGQVRDQCAQLVLQILEDVRELSRLIRPPILDDLGLWPALAWLARRVRESSGIAVELETSGAEGLKPCPELSTLVFRLVQEALHNAVRHASAQKIRIRARLAGNRLEIEIRDDGVGFEPDSLEQRPDERGVGLAGMRDRVELFGGDFSLRSAPGRGTAVLAGLLLDEHPENAA
jgi:two-component system, NarL family, sensor kinase